MNVIDISLARTLIEQGYETRNVEYKGSMTWERAKPKVAKAILALSNVTDGGWLIFGIEKKNNHYESVGLSPGAEQWFNYDQISAYAATFADPYVDFEVEVVLHNDKKFGIIKVNDFPELPVICKKGTDEGLSNGKMYTRSRRMNETTEVNNSNDMREIVDLAMRKRFQKTISIVSPDGLIETSQTSSDQDKFDSEAADFL